MRVERTSLVVGRTLAVSRGHVSELHDPVNPALDEIARGVELEAESETLLAVETVGNLGTAASGGCGLAWRCLVTLVAGKVAPPGMASITPSIALASSPAQLLVSGRQDVGNHGNAWRVALRPAPNASIIGS